MASKKAAKKKKVTRKVAAKKKRPATRKTAKKKPARASRKVAAKKKPTRTSRKAAKKAPKPAAAAPPVSPKTPAGEADTTGDGAASEVREIFRAYDRDGSGSIDRSEFSRLLEALGMTPDEEELAVALDVVDANHSGKISWPEFYAWWTSR